MRKRKVKSLLAPAVVFPLLLSQLNDVSHIVKKKEQKANRDSGQYGIFGKGKFVGGNSNKYQ